ncbi:MAG: radical SAM protein [Candidatus Omnitrophota bacterium]
MRQVYLIYLSDSRYDYAGLINTKRMKVSPKLGLPYLKGALNIKGIKAEVFDQDINNFSMDDLISKIKVDQPFFVGFYASERLKDSVLLWLERIRQHCHSTLLVVGGPGFFSYTDYHQVGCDIVCHGEGEVTVLEIVEYVQGQRNLASIRGISWKDGETITVNAARAPISDLDSIPFPIRENIDKYVDNHYFTMKKPFVSMMASRGCQWRCSYCASPEIWGKITRCRSVKNVVDEIESLVLNYKIKYIAFKDDCFGSKLSWLREFSETMVLRNFGVKFSCMVNPSDLCHGYEEKIILLKTAGCDMLIFGVQSADPDILAKIGRPYIGVDALPSIVRFSKKSGICVVLEFIFGLPGETKASVNKTINFVSRVRPNVVQYNLLKLLEGSDLFNSKQMDDVPIMISHRQLRKIVFLAYFRHYLAPEIFFHNIFFIIRYNPKYIFSGLALILYPFTMAVRLICSGCFSLKKD